MRYLVITVAVFSFITGFVRNIDHTGIMQEASVQEIASVTQ